MVENGLLRYFHAEFDKNEVSTYHEITKVDVLKVLT